MATKRDILRDAANEAGLEFTGGEKPIPEPVVSADPLGNLSLVWEADGIQVQANSIERGRRSIDCYLSFRQLSPNKWIKAPRRINLLSESAMGPLAKNLERRKSLDWESRLDQVVVAVNRALSEQRSVQILKRRTEGIEQDWLVRPFLERNQHTMLVAEGGSGKSMMALALLVATLTGEKLLPGLDVAKVAGGGLYLDWETDAATHERRLTMLCDAFGIEIPDIHYIRMSVPLVEDVQFLYEYIVKNRIKIGVADSVGMATSGDMNSQQDAVAYVSAVRALGEMTFLSITHPGWANTNRATGSRYFENAPRSVWHLEKQQAEGALTAHLDFKNTKTNNGVRQPAFALDVSFEDGIRYSSSEVSEDKRSEPQQILDLLLATGKLKLEAIYEDLDNIPKSNVRKHLADLKKAGKVEQFGRGEYGALLHVATESSNGSEEGFATYTPSKEGEYRGSGSNPSQIRYPYKEIEEELQF